jgi:plastocyanin
MNKYPLAAGAAALLFALTSCGSSSSPTATTPAPTSPAMTSPMSPGVTAPTTAAPVPASGGITIKDFAFSGTLTVKPGQKVTVTNEDSAPHTLTDSGGKFDTGTIDGNGGTGTFTAPTQPGSYQLKCTFHPQMSGTLVVKG